MAFLRETLRVIARILLWLPIKAGRLFGVVCVLAGALGQVVNHDVPGRAIMAGMLIVGGIMVVAWGRFDRILRPSR